jgi:hypothetical protein
MLLDNLASKRGRLIDTVTSAFSMSVNSNPIGMDGLKARPSEISASVTLIFMGSGVSTESGKPVTMLPASSVSSTRMLESSGT